MEIDTIKISELAEGNMINNDSILVYNLNGQTKKITFQNLKNAVISALASEVSQLDADLEAEATARAAADTSLAGDITAEATARTAADTALAGDITAEAAARTAADTTLGNQISALDSRMVNYILKFDAATNRFPLEDNMLPPLGNSQLTLVARNAQSGAIHLIWYNNSERKFALSTTLSGNPPSNNDSINVQYIAQNR